MSKSYWFTSPKTLTLGLTWPPRGIHFWSLCHHFWSQSSLLVTTSDFFFMFPPPPRNERYLAAARVARGGFFMRAGRPGPASNNNIHAYKWVNRILVLLPPINSPLLRFTNQLTHPLPLPMTGTPCALWGRDPLLWRPRDPLYARKEPLRPGAWEGEADVEKEEEDLTSAVGSS